jgi:hypothetical protein
VGKGKEGEVDVLGLENLVEKTPNRAD